MKSFFLPFLLVIAVVSGNLHAQQKILFTENSNRSFLLKSNDGQLTDDVKFVLSKLAEGQNRPVAGIELTISYEEGLRVVRNSPAQITASVDGRKFTVGGDLVYKRFDVSAYLVPDEMSFTSILRPASSRLKPLPTDSRTKIRVGTAERVEYEVADSVNNQWKLEVRQQKFQYSDAALTEFKERIALISEYYVSSARIDQVALRLRTINAYDVEHLDFQNAALIEIENEIGRMESKNYAGRLPLYENDPAEFRMRFGALKEDAFARRSTMNQVKGTLYVHYYNAALDLLDHGKRPAARDYFNRALRENPLFVPAAFELARMDYKDGKADRAEERLRDILYRMNPDVHDRQLSVDFLEEIYLQYLEEGEHLTAQKKYGEAIRVLDRAEGICKDVSEIRCSNALTVAYRNARSGYYQSRLDMARRSYQEGNLTEAEKNLQDALRYRDQHNMETPAADEALNMLKGIRQKRYDTHVETGRTYLRQHSFEKALDAFDEAETIQQRYQLASDAGLDAYKKQAARPVVLAKINKGKNLAGTNNLGEARKLSKEILSMQNQYGLAADNEINKEYSGLKESIFSQECVNAQNDFDGIFARMRDAIRKKNYIDADRLYKEADAILEEYAECSLNSGSLRTEHDSVIPAYVYQSLVNELLAAQSNGRFSDAVARYKDADTYFHRYDVTKFGISHPSLAEFAVDKGNNDFLLFLGNNFRSRKEYENSLRMYQALLSRGFSSADFKEPLYRLGTELALRDRQINPSANPKQKVLEYTSGDKRLKKLNKGYVKGWKMKK